MCVHQFGPRKELDKTDAAHIVYLWIPIMLVKDTQTFTEIYVNTFILIYIRHYFTNIKFLLNSVFRFPYLNPGAPPSSLMQNEKIWFHKRQGKIRELCETSFPSSLVSRLRRSRNWSHIVRIWSERF